MVYIFDKVRSFSRGCREVEFMYIFGDEEGLKRWERYRTSQSVTNTFEYKNQKYGITKEEFDIYNKSRASTLANRIEKYGNDGGLVKWNEYCDRQSFTNSEEHLGTERFNAVNRLKSHTYEVYLERYGDESLAEEKLYAYYDKISSTMGYSKKSQILFDMLLCDNLFINTKSYYATKNKEYGILDKPNNRYCKYDFVCLDYMFGIEFQGDHYHGNPKLYLPSSTLKGRGCTQKIVKDVWQYDLDKKLLAKVERNIEIVAVWESDWDENRQLVIDRIIDYVRSTL